MSLWQGVEQWFAGVEADFVKNLVVGDRWRALFSGLGVTLEITLFSTVFGMILGVLVAFMRLSNVRIGRWRFLRSIATIYVDVIRGTPVVVQLLIMSLVVMASFRGDKAVVAIVAFSVNSGAYVSEIVRSGILAVDKGQTEAGRSLGLSGAATMVLIVMPQAIKIIIPSLFNEFIMLLKETAIVGYIGLMDLTKTGDFIRSRTLSGFFPLMTVALVYLVIVTILTRVFNYIERRMRQGDQH